MAERVSKSATRDDEGAKRRPDGDRECRGENRSGDYDRALYHAPSLLSLEFDFGGAAATWSGSEAESETHRDTGDEAGDDFGRRSVKECAAICDPSDRLLVS